MKSPEHGVRQLPVPWAESNSRFTALFESLVIDWLKTGTISEVAERLALSWSAVSGVQEQAVARGLARRQQDFPDTVGIDETAFQRRGPLVFLIRQRTAACAKISVRHHSWPPRCALPRKR